MSSWSYQYPRKKKIHLLTNSLTDMYRNITLTETCFGIVANKHCLSYLASAKLWLNNFFAKPMHKRYVLFNIFRDSWVVCPFPNCFIKRLVHELNPETHKLTKNSWNKLRETYKWSLDSKSTLNCSPSSRARLIFCSWDLGSPIFPWDQVSFSIGRSRDITNLAGSILSRHCTRSCNELCE